MIDSGSLSNVPAGTLLDIVKGKHAGTWVKINSTQTELLNLWCNIKTGDLVHYSHLESALKMPIVTDKDPWRNGYGLFIHLIRD